MSQRALAMCLLVVVAMAAGSWWAFGRVPEDARVAVHFGLDGTPDRFASPAMAFAILPLAAAVAVALMAVLPLISAATRIPEASRSAYAITAVAVVLVLAAAHAMIIAHAIGVAVPVLRWMTGVVGLMLIVTGNYASRIRPNAIYGVRTPWTLADPEVWAKTHRLYAWLSVLLGLGLVAVALTSVPPLVAASALIGAIAILVLMTVILSYLISRGRPGTSH